MSPHKRMTAQEAADRFIPKERRLGARFVVVGDTDGYRGFRFIYDLDTNEVVKIEAAE